MKIITTSDGSHTIIIPNSTECYHSTHGAIQESVHVFINAGLRKKASEVLTFPIKLLEIGFGTGLNALLTATVSKEIGKIHYTAIEPFPVPKTLWQSLNYEEKVPHASGLLTGLHDSPWEKDISILPSFTIHKTKKHLSPHWSKNTFDLIYFDAFSPNTQPDLWSKDTFMLLYRLLAPHGILVTYCAKGIVKQRLRAAGFTIERLPGAHGKRHMIRANRGRSLGDGA